MSALAPESDIAQVSPLIPAHGVSAMGITPQLIADYRCRVPAPGSILDDCDLVSRKNGGDVVFRTHLPQ